MKLNIPEDDLLFNTVAYSRLLTSKLENKNPQSAHKKTQPTVQPKTTGTW